MRLTKYEQINTFYLSTNTKPESKLKTLTLGGERQDRSFGNTVHMSLCADHYQNETNGNVS